MKLFTKYCVVTISCYRWPNSCGGHRFIDFIPELNRNGNGEEGDDGNDEPDAAGKKRKRINKETNKGALYEAYDTRVHCWVAHLRRVHPHLPPTLMDVDGKKIPVKASDPLAPKGRPLYYFHSKTPYYNDLFFFLWDIVIPPVFQYVSPWLIVKSKKHLQTLLSLEFTG